MLWKALPVVPLLLIGAAAMASGTRPQGNAPEFTIGAMRVQTLAGFSFLSLSKQTTHDQIAPVIGELVGSTMSAVKAAGVLPLGGEIAIYHGASTVGQPFTLEAGFSVPPDTRPAGGATLRVVKPFHCAAAVYSGGIAHLGQAIAKLYQDMQRAGLESDGEYREYYLYWEDVSSPNNVTLLAFGIKQKADQAAESQAESPPIPRIIHKDAFLVAGMRYEGKNEQGEIPALWDNSFLPRMSELDALRSDDQGAYGVSRALPGVEPGPFEYLACVAVTSLDNLPEGMVGWQVPAHDYAVFLAKDIPDISRVLDHFFREWLPKSGYQFADNYTFEYYPPSFPDDGTIYVYCPVGPKASEGEAE